jgi:hypothetical protein
MKIFIGNEPDIKDENIDEKSNKQEYGRLDWELQDLTLLTFLNPALKQLGHVHELT